MSLDRDLEISRHGLVTESGEDVHHFDRDSFDRFSVLPDLVECCVYESLVSVGNSGYTELAIRVVNHSSWELVLGDLE